MWPDKKEEKLKVDYLSVKMTVPQSDPLIFEMNAEEDDTFGVDDAVLGIDCADGRQVYFPLHGVQYYIYSTEKPR